MDVDREQLITMIMTRHRAISRSLAEQSTASWLTLDLTIAQLKVLIVLAEEGAVAVGQIATRLGVTVPTASHLIDRLEQTGYVTRGEDIEDRRRTLARLSATGEALVNELFQSGESSMRAVLGRLNDAELMILAGSLDPLVNAATQALKHDATATEPVTTAPGQPAYVTSDDKLAR